MSSDSDSNIVLVDYEGHKFKRLDTSEFLLAKILKKIDNQDKKIDSIDRKIDSIDRQVKAIAAMARKKEEI